VYRNSGNCKTASFSNFLKIKLYLFHFHFSSIFQFSGFTFLVQNSKTAFSGYFSTIPNHNYCRAEDDNNKGAWCYINEDEDWDYCSCSSIARARDRSCLILDSISLPNAGSGGCFGLKIFDNEGNLLYNADQKEYADGHHELCFYGKAAKVEFTAEHSKQ